MAKRLRGERKGGIPWTVITDEMGVELIASDGPEGNIGCPVDPHEIEWFMTMIKKTARTLTAEHIETIKVALQAYAKEIRG